MQRENYILRNTTVKRGVKRNLRSGIAMMMAIITLVVISTIMALSLSMTAQTTKQSTDLYLHEQATLLSQSATEYALLQISQNPPCSSLSDKLNFVENGIYDINISLGYIYDSNISCITNGGKLYAIVTTPEQNGSVLIDVTVSVTDKNISTEPIKIFRRTIQKL